jgi:hypothetical protein
MNWRLGHRVGQIIGFCQSDRAESCVDANLDLRGAKAMPLQQGPVKQNYTGVVRGVHDADVSKESVSNLHHLRRVCLPWVG